MIIQDVEKKLEEILTFYSRKEDNSLLSLAKEKYFKITGTVDHDTQDFEHKMTSFTEWFVLHFSPYRSGLKIFEIYQKEVGLSETLKNYCSAIYYSVFDPLDSANANQSIIRDCIEGSKHTISTSHNPYMVVKGEIFVGRILPTPEGTYLLKGIVPLPYEVRDFVEKSSKLVDNKKIDFMPEEFCLALEGMKYQSLQYQHIDPKKIFNI